MYSVSSNAVARELNYSSTTISCNKLTGDITIKKYGKIVNVQYNGGLKANQTFTDGELIATIPADYKPSLHQRVLVRYYDASQQIWLTVSSDGKIYFYGSMTAIAAVVNFQFFLTYII